MKLIKLIEYKRRINTLENEIETLREIMKSEMYETLLTKQEYITKNKKLESTNRKLRKDIKLLKEKMKEKVK